MNETKKLVESLRDQHYKLVERVKELEVQACKEHDYELKHCIGSAYKICKLCKYEEYMHKNPEQELFDIEKKQFEIRKATKILQDNGFEVKGMK